MSCTAAILILKRTQFPKGDDPLCSKWARENAEENDKAVYDSERHHVNQACTQFRLIISLYFCEQWRNLLIKYLFEIH